MLQKNKSRKTMENQYHHKGRILKVLFSLVWIIGCGAVVNDVTNQDNSKAVVKNNTTISENDFIIDSNMTLTKALKGVDENCLISICKKQTLIDVEYYSFDSKIHHGQIVIDKELAEDIKTVFKVALKSHFPIQSVIPIADKRFQWDDDLSMAANNTSALNYRENTSGTRLSKHAYGRAIDINPYLNPYIKGNITRPDGADYIPNNAGTLTAEHPIVKKFLQLGWKWGGNWRTLKDYQHFEK